jgi:hypothetical protein
MEDWEMNELVDSEDRNSYIRERKKYAKPGEHIPNKNEAKFLRKIMSETGMSEEEVRAHKTYRKMLSEAQKVPAAKKTDDQKRLDNIMKRVTKSLKLAKEHPKVQEEFYRILKEEYPWIRPPGKLKTTKSKK